MKKIIFISLITLISSCRIADFTMLSTKNIGDKEYVLLKSNVTAKAFHLKTASDKCIEKVEGGFYLVNVVIFDCGFRYKVKGDVYGLKQ